MRGAKRPLIRSHLLVGKHPLYLSPSVTAGKRLLCLSPSVIGREAPDNSSAINYIIPVGERYVNLAVQKSIAF